MWKWLIGLLMGGGAIFFLSGTNVETIKANAVDLLPSQSETPAATPAVE